MSKILKKKTKLNKKADLSPDKKTTNKINIGTKFIYPFLKIFINRKEENIIVEKYPPRTSSEPKKPEYL